MIVSIDFESRSLVELKKAGLRRYAEDYSTKILCMAWAIDDEEPEIWLPTQEFPRRLRQAVEREAQFNAWNAQFEMEIWRQRSPSDWPKIADTMWHDTMGDAASCGFPLKLDTCAKAIGTEEKLAEGTRLINKLCKPKRDGTFWEYDECPKDFQALYTYCKQDVRAERSVFQSLPAHVEGAEDVLQRLTWTSNRRGVPIDVDSVNTIQKRLTERIEQVDRAVQKMTGGELDSARQRDKLLMNLEMNREASKLYVQDRELRLSIGLKNPRLKVSDIPGIKLSTTQSETVEDVLKNWDLSEYDRELLGYQQDLRHASVAKFKKLKLQICNDDTVKDNIQFHGAGTGRDAGRGFQLQNLPRVTSSDPELRLSWFRKHGADVLDMLAPVLELASSLIRPMICAPAGMKLVVSDSGQIEARGTAWLVKEENILQDFRDGIDPYISQASAMYDIPMEEVTGIQRNYGKLAVLACGFQGSHKALTKFAEGYGLVIERKTAVQVVKKFRNSRPRLVAAWSAFGEAAILAINDAGTPYQVHGCQKAVFQMQGRHLTMELPSGRKLWYPYATVEVVTVRYEDGETGEMKSFQSQSMTSMWVDSMTHKWARRSMSGGNLLQNWVQATCRDIVLREAVPRLEGMGYPIVARVHDEVICLCEDHPKYNVAEVDYALCVVPDWAEGLPLSAKGYESKRYRK